MHPDVLGFCLSCFENRKKNPIGIRKNPWQTPLIYYIFPLYHSNQIWFYLNKSFIIFIPTSSSFLCFQWYNFIPMLVVFERSLNCPKRHHEFFCGLKRARNKSHAGPLDQLKFSWRLLTSILCKTILHCMHFHFASL